MGGDWVKVDKAGVGWGGVGWGAWEIGTEKDFAWGDGCTIQCTDDVLLSCTLETCMVLRTNVTPINSIKKCR